mmetsp:Transcript_3071/g.7318  ORF Transcript_3071/g.7318 Transcript_3071/m.7318 type:complete len:297 (-) Transcript_3071:523-1413(-)
MQILVAAHPFPAGGERVSHLAAHGRGRWRRRWSRRRDRRLCYHRFVQGHVVALQRTRDVVPHVDSRCKRRRELRKLRARGALRCGLVPINVHLEPIERDGVPHIAPIAAELDAQVGVEPLGARCAHRPRWQGEQTRAHRVRDVRGWKGVVPLGHVKPRVLRPVQQIIHVIRRFERRARVEGLGDGFPTGGRLAVFVQQRECRGQVVEARVGGAARSRHSAGDCHGVSVRGRPGQRQPPDGCRRCNGPRHHVWVANAEPRAEHPAVRAAKGHNRGVGGAPLGLESPDERGVVCKRLC